MNKFIKYLPSSKKFTRQSIEDYLLSLAGKKEKRIWCKNPWFNLSLKEEGYGPCCRITFQKEYKNGKELSILWNSNEMQKLRLDLVNGNIGRVVTGDPFNRIAEFHPCYNCPDKNLDIDTPLSFKNTINKGSENESSSIKEYIRGDSYLKNSPKKLSVCSSKQGKHSNLSCLGESFPEIKYTIFSDLLFFYGYHKKFKLNIGDINSFSHKVIILLIKKIKVLNKFYSLNINLNLNSDIRFLEKLNGIDNISLIFHFGNNYKSLKNFKEELDLFSYKMPLLMQFVTNKEVDFLISCQISKYNIDSIDEIIKISELLNCDILFTLLENNYNEREIKLQSNLLTANVIKNNNERYIENCIYKLIKYSTKLSNQKKASHSLKNIISLLKSYLRDLKYNNYALKNVRYMFNAGAYGSGQKLVEGLIEKYPLYYKNYLYISRFIAKNLNWHNKRYLKNHIREGSIIFKNRKSIHLNEIINYKLEKYFQEKLDIHKEFINEEIERELPNNKLTLKQSIKKIIKKIATKSTGLLKIIFGIKTYKNLSSLTKIILKKFINILIYTRISKFFKKFTRVLLGENLFNKIKKLFNKIVTILDRQS